MAEEAGQPGCGHELLVLTSAFVRSPPLPAGLGLACCLVQGSARGMGGSKRLGTSKHFPTWSLLSMLALNFASWVPITSRCSAGWYSTFSSDCRIPQSCRVLRACVHAPHVTYISTCAHVTCWTQAIQRTAVMLINICVCAFCSHHMFAGLH